MSCSLPCAFEYVEQGRPGGVEGHSIENKWEVGGQQQDVPLGLQDPTEVHASSHPRICYWILVMRGGCGCICVYMWNVLILQPGQPKELSCLSGWLCEASQVWLTWVVPRSNTGRRLNASQGVQWNYGPG